MKLNNFSAMELSEPKVKLQACRCYVNHIIRNKCNDALLYFMIYKINVSSVLMFVVFKFIFRFKTSKVIQLQCCINLTCTLNHKNYNKLI